MIEVVKDGLSTETFRVLSSSFLPADTELVAGIPRAMESEVKAHSTPNRCRAVHIVGVGEGAD